MKVIYGKHSMMKFNKLLTLFMLLSIAGFAQDKTSKWTFGLNIGVIPSVKTYPTEETVSNIQIPNININRYIYKGITLGAGLTFTGIRLEQELDLLMMDFYAKYDFNQSENKIVPFVVAGPSLLFDVPAARSYALHLGGGIHYWLWPSVALSAQLQHRYIVASNTLDSHNQIFVGALFSFNESKGKRNKRRKGYGFTTN